MAVPIDDSNLPPPPGGCERLAQVWRALTGPAPAARAAWNRQSGLLASLLLVMLALAGLSALALYRAKQAGRNQVGMVS